MYAADGSHKSVVELLVEAGADANIKDKDGSTALLLTCFWGTEEVVRLLIKGGANVNIKDNEGRSPIDMASFWNREGIRQLLIEAGAAWDGHMTV